MVSTDTWKDTSKVVLALLRGAKQCSGELVPHVGLAFGRPLGELDIIGTRPLCSGWNQDIAAAVWLNHERGSECFSIVTQ